MNKNIIINNSEVEISLDKKTPNLLEFRLNNKQYKAQVISRSEEELTISLNGIVSKVYVEDFENRGFKQVFTNSKEELVKILPKVVGSSQKGAAEGSMESPMPGKIFKILKSSGEEVKTGETILILEAMKMEHAIKASSDGVIKEIFYKEGEQVTGGAELCAIE